MGRTRRLIPMRGYGRYWIFFVIVAVGLTLSWGQVGRKTQRVLEGQRVVVLTPEADCSPLLRPCAATAADRAIVVGPVEGGLRVSQLGFDGEEVNDIDMTFRDAGGLVVGNAGLAAGEGPWVLTQVPESAVSIRLAVADNQGVSIAEMGLAPR